MYASRGGLKLHHALHEFGVSVQGLVCADLGCSTGGFTDCLLAHGAARVHAVDTAYGELAWKLRNDPRVVVQERTNALHAAPPPGGVGVVVIDLSWTPQRLAIPAALRWTSPGGRIVSLIKPHYEMKELGRTLPRGGVLDEVTAEEVTHAICTRIAEYGGRLLGLTRSPVLGGKGRGNAEWLALVAAATES